MYNKVIAKEDEQNIYCIVVKNENLYRKNEQLLLRNITLNEEYSDLEYNAEQIDTQINQMKWMIFVLCILLFCDVIIIKWDLAIWKLEHSSFGDFIQGNDIHGNFNC